jgi:hypothetical protein
VGESAGSAQSLPAVGLGPRCHTPARELATVHRPRASLPIVGPRRRPSAGGARPPSLHGHHALRPVAGEAVLRVPIWISERAHGEKKNRKEEEDSGEQ